MNRNTSESFKPVKMVLDGSEHKSARSKNQMLKLIS